MVTKVSENAGRNLLWSDYGYLPWRVTTNDLYGSKDQRKKYKPYGYLVGLVPGKDESRKHDETVDIIPEAIFYMDDRRYVTRVDFLHVNESDYQTINRDKVAKKDPNQAELLGNFRKDTVCYLLNMKFWDQLQGLNRTPNDSEANAIVREIMAIIDICDETPISKTKFEDEKLRAERKNFWNNFRDEPNTSIPLMVVHDLNENTLKKYTFPKKIQTIEI